jgi:phosphocarrier protein HPr
LKTAVTQRTVTVVNELGLHARAAARFVHLATRFESQIRVARSSKVMDGKSIMGILLLAAARGTAITISAQGADEDAAVDALVQLVESGFGEPSTSLGPGPSTSLGAGSSTPVDPQGTPQRSGRPG